MVMTTTTRRKTRPARTTWRFGRLVLLNILQRSLSMNRHDYLECYGDELGRMFGYSATKVVTVTVANTSASDVNVLTPERGELLGLDVTDPNASGYTWSAAEYPASSGCTNWSQNLATCHRSLPNRSLERRTKYAKSLISSTPTNC